jgi:hypothetical protein
MNEKDFFEGAWENWREIRDDIMRHKKPTFSVQK